MYYEVKGKTQPRINVEKTNAEGAARLAGRPLRGSSIRLGGKSEPGKEGLSDGQQSISPFT